MASPLGIIDTSSISYTTKAGKTKSVFNGTKFYFRPVMNKSTGLAQSSTINDIHTNDLYDTSIPSIINYLDNYPSMRLKPVDFAYLTDLGIYPNNRLVVCRRFGGPVGNDLTSLNVNEGDVNPPLSTIISWIDDSGDFFNFTFGEYWTNAKDDIFSLFEKVNKETGIDSIPGVSGAVKGMVGKVTGAPEGVQNALLVEIANKLGYTEVTVDNIPQGNPNLIQQAKVRSKGGDGLRSKLSIAVTAKYEQKFINNVDPTIAFLDIIGNILRFGTSNSDFILTGKGGDTIKKYFDNIKKGKWVEALSLIVGVIIDAVLATYEIVKEKLVQLADDLVKKGGDAIKSAASGDFDAAKNSALAATKVITDTLRKIGSAVISKYKVEISGIVSALTGFPSTPWHVTIGNPKRPFFSSGDMYISGNVSVKFGSILSFNDLPSTIEVSFTLESARDLGAQEIFERFNTGGGRSYQPIPDMWEMNIELADLKDAEDNNSNSRVEVDTNKTSQASIIGNSVGAVRPERGLNSDPGLPGGNNNQLIPRTSTEIETEKEDATNIFKKKSFL